MKIRERIAQVVRDLRELEVIQPTDKITYSNFDSYQITITASPCDGYVVDPLRCLTIWNTFKDEFSQEEIILDNYDGGSNIYFCFCKTKQTNKEGS